MANRSESVYKRAGEPSVTFYEKEGTAKRVIDFYKIKNRNKQRSFRFGGEGGIRTHVSVKTNAFRVFYFQHTLADFEKKCPILREKALVRKKMIFSPLRLFPTVRNARELSERTDRTAIKHNNRKSP